MNYMQSYGSNEYIIHIIGGRQLYALYARHVLHHNFMAYMQLYRLYVNCMQLYG